MTCTCQHITIYQQKQYDPTHTTALRNAFVRDLKRRFRELKVAIRQTVDVDDCFGLNDIKVYGGEGSGNFGHEGRPGEVGGSGEGGHIIDYLDDPQKAMERIDTKIEELQEKGEDNPDNHEYAALTHISTVLQQRIDTKLSERKFWRFVYSQRDDGLILAAGSLQFDNAGGKILTKSCEIKNLGSIVRGEGKKVVEELFKEAKQMGVQEVRLMSTARSFYEKLGFVYDEETHYMVAKLKDITIHKLTTPGRATFAYPRSQDKVTKFMTWLERQVLGGLLEVKTFNQIGQGIESAWTNKYIIDSYKRGVMRSRMEMKDAGMVIPSLEATGGISMSMAAPVHLDRVGLLYTRAYNELKGITSAMDSQISRILAQGIADGDNPRLLARKLISVIDGSGAGALGITDSLGRFIPAERRAEMLARTEIIRAHHMATIQEYRNWALEGVKVQGEWKTAGDSRVCAECEELEGQIFSLDEIESMIPVHPMCRCIALPSFGKQWEKDIKNRNKK